MGKTQAQALNWKREIVARATKVEDMPGVTAPLGFWDPWGFSTEIPEGTLLYWREAEIKHGRVAMLGFLGLLLTDKTTGLGIHPFYGGDAEWTNFIAAHFKPVVLKTFWPALFFSCGIVEWGSGNPMRLDEKGARAPGDLGFDPLGLKPQDEQEWREMQTRELNNGRLAMIAAIGWVMQEFWFVEKKLPINPWDGSRILPLGVK